MVLRVDVEQLKQRIGVALRVALADAGLKQPALAETIGWSPSAVGSWVTGQNVISIEAALAIDDALGWPPGELLARAGVIARTPLVVAITIEESLDDDARDVMRETFRVQIGATARRRIAAIHCGDDEDDTATEDEIFGPEWSSTYAPPS